MLIKVTPRSKWKDMGFISRTASFPTSGVIVVTRGGIQIYFTVKDLEGFVRALSKENDAD